MQYDSRPSILILELSMKGDLQLLQKYFFM